LPSSTTSTVRLPAQKPRTSSGTSGTMSFFPKTAKDYRMSVRMLRLQLTQQFGHILGSQQLLRRQARPCRSKAWPP